MWTSPVAPLATGVVPKEGMLKAFPLVILAWLAACGGAAESVDGGGSLDGVGPVGDAGDPADAAPPCSPTADPTEVCDGDDNNCDGRTDDVDPGADGFFDCAAVAIFGNPAGGGTVLRTSLAAAGAPLSAIQNADDAIPPLTAAVLAPFRVVVLDQLVRAYTVDEGAALAAWVTAGGGLVVLSGHSGAPTDVDATNDLMAGLGLALAPALVSGPVTELAVHPTTTGLTSLPIMGGHTVGVVGDVVGGVNTAIATLGGAPVGIAQRRGAGRVLVWGDDWIALDDQWVEPQVQAIWRQAFAWVGRVE